MLIKNARMACVGLVLSVVIPAALAASEKLAGRKAEAEAARQPLVTRWASALR